MLNVVDTDVTYDTERDMCAGWERTDIYFIYIKEMATNKV